MLLPTHHEIDVAPADCEQRSCLLRSGIIVFGTLPRSHLGRLVDLTAAIVVPDDQRQMSRSGAAERYWRTREELQLRLWYRPRDRGSWWRLVLLGRRCGLAIGAGL